ncbi:hypothetical protein BGZ74_005708, partial [Mortierella antarctica]
MSNGAILSADQTTLDNSVISATQASECAIEGAVFWIVNDLLPFSALDSDGLRTFVEAFNPVMHVPCSDTVRAQLPILASSLKGQLQQLIGSTLQFGALTFDGWSSGAFKPFLGITLDWIDQSFKQHTCILAMAPMPFPHDATSTAVLV